MKCVTITNGKVIHGISVVDGEFQISQEGRKGRPIILPVPAGATIRNFYCLNLKVKLQYEKAVLIFLTDHSECLGDWELEGADDAIIKIAEGKQQAVVKNTLLSCCLKSILI